MKKKCSRVINQLHAVQGKREEKKERLSGTE
jgi:hypothetical protein